MKVGIIGGGIAGLSCAYRLAQKGIKSKVFEKDITPGGRLQWSAVVSGKEVHPYTYSLLEEMGLEAAVVPMKMEDVGAIMPDGRLMKMEELPSMIERFSPKESEFFQKMGNFFNENPLDIKNITSQMAELRDISFADYMQKENFPYVLKPLLEIETNIRLVDWNEISAEYGMACIAPMFTTLPSGKTYVFEENMMVLSNVLTRKINSIGSKVETSAEVKKIEKKEDGFLVSYEKNFVEKEGEYDKIVLALPPLFIKRIFPELRIENDIKYKNGRCIMVEGKLRKEYDRKVSFGLSGHKSNLCLINAMDPYEHRLYPLNPEKEVDLNSVYEDCKVLSEKDLKPAWPVVPPNAKIPELKTHMEGVYLCGDFYHFPTHDTSVATGEMVAEMIEKEVQ